MQTPNPRLISAQQAATRLGVKLETVYAYVSRGLPTRREGATPSKASRFDASDVERLATRARRSAGLRAQPLIIPSEITELHADDVTYRGISALELSAKFNFEQVAEWLWEVPAAESRPFVAARFAIALARSIQV